MKRNIYLSFAVIKGLTSCFLILLSLPVYSEIDSADARLLASQCAQCHGTTGNTLGDFDSIAGENFSELYDELIEMKQDNDNKVMHKQIQGYTDNQLWMIADFYSNLSKTGTSGEGSDSGSDSDGGNENDSGNVSDTDNEGSLNTESEFKAIEVAKEAEKKREEKAKKIAEKKAKKALKKIKKAEKAEKKRLKKARKAAERKAKKAKQKKEKNESEDD